ncbi:cyanophycin synthetase [Actinomadura livida]|uniref:Cyanophycin synthetase n=1 Tax=Actinomadura livida TaxID=79909 RepID=A0A7W7IDK1_9ACTN|nr:MULTISPECIES: cyanophycin synthetase [Actinomadura]MBB4775142.1 cyanophycin synthetase [Actinomadura catellatispora]GGT88136.1 cyanophycin synthetase [Actinomadura livida]
MRLDHVRRLSGPNVYLSRPVAIARLDLQGLAGHETTDHPGFAARLVDALPGLATHHCAAGRPGGLLDAMARGTYFGHVTEHVTLELSGAIGREVFFGRTVRAGGPADYDVVLECPRDEPAGSTVVEQLVALALRTVQGALAGRVPDPSADLARVAAVHEGERLGVSTAALARAARRRGVPVRRVGGLNLLRLGYGRYRRMIWAAMTDATSAIGMEVAGDKRLAHRVLADAGLPVPEGRVAASPAEALEALRGIGGPVVVKPLAGHQGEGVHIGLTTAPEVVAAFASAAGAAGGGGAAGEGGGEVIVESYIPGKDYRVLVVGGRVSAAAELTAACVAGDGAATVAALVDRVNADPARGAGHDRPLTRLALGPAELALLARQGHGPGTVPAAGERVWLRRNANLSTGGTSRDVTGEVHADVADLCVRAAAAVGMDVCGIDLRLPDIGSPPPAEPGAAGILEVNAAPGLRMHLAPHEGAARDVAGDVIDLMYPAGTPSRVPVVSVTGTNGKTTTVRMIARMLELDGRRTGMTSTEGVHIGGRLVHRSDASGPRSAEMVLGDRSVEAAVLETARGGIVRRGLGYERADVAVVTNITRDHLGVDATEDLDDLTGIKALVAEEIRRGGHVVLNAADPPAAGLALRRAVRDRRPVLRYFAPSPGEPVLAAHLREGGVGYCVADGWLTEARGDRRTRILPAADVAGSFGGHAGHVVANALAAAAAARALDVPVETVARALRTFDPHTHNPGRGCVYLVSGNPVLVDYAHNPAAVAAMGALVERRWGTGGVAAVTLPGDRSDELVGETARALARTFGRVVVYEDEDLRGRRSGEMTRLIAEGLREARPDVRHHPAGDLKGALTSALDMAGPGEPVLLLYEKLQPVAELLDTLGARPDEAAGGQSPEGQVTGSPT